MGLFFPFPYLSGERSSLPDQKILLIDDDPTLLDLLGEHASSAGYQVFQASNGRDGLEMQQQHKPDLVVLDVMMPTMDGWEVCERIRKNSATPIILLTAKNEEFDKLRGFRLGVDDYMTKPFSFAELLARVGAVLSRAKQSGASESVVGSGELSIDFDQRQVSRAGKVIELTPTEYRLLRVLTRNANRAVPVEKLLVEVWGPEYATENEHVKHFIWSLRKKIELDPGAPQHILTVRGFGYRFE